VKKLLKDTDISDLFQQHIVEKVARFQLMLEKLGWDEIVIGSGGGKVQFQDDMAYPFKVNPYFREWMPLDKRHNCFLLIQRGSDKPKLYLSCVEDIWHSAPQTLADNYSQHIDIIEYDSVDKLKKYLGKNQNKQVLINETNDLEITEAQWNPQQVLHAIDFQRRHKTAYEHACVRQATYEAVPAHRAAEQAFRAGASELEIASAYLSACKCSENEMPYAIIAGINENAAVLHHHQLNNQPVTPRSFLIDAGVQFNNYASDITRTYAFDRGSEFAAMIASLDKVQQELVCAGAIGKSPMDLQVLAQQKLAQILIDFKLLKVSIEQALEKKIINSFFPHGLGHHLGSSVHDKGSRLANAGGELIASSKKYPNLRASAPMVANQIYTVEPGIYFIPTLLEKLRSKEPSCVNWRNIKNWIPFGGIRIEDNIILHEDDRLENITRQAFKS
jgi:Xaa-Pro dipeptidase